MNKKEVLEKIKLLETKLENLKQIVDKPDNGRWIPEEGELYYCIECSGDINWYQNNGYDGDINCIKIFNCFKTEEEAQRQLELRNIHYKILEIATRLGIPTAEDWKDTVVKKYHLYYAWHREEIKTSIDYSAQYQGTIYCLSKNFEKVCTEEIGKDDLTDYLINWGG